MGCHKLFVLRSSCRSLVTVSRGSLNHSYKPLLKTLIPPSHTRTYLFIYFFPRGHNYNFQRPQRRFVGFSHMFVVCLWCLVKVPPASQNCPLSLKRFLSAPKTTIFKGRRRGKLGSHNFFVCSTFMLRKPCQKYHRTHKTTY